MDKNIDKQLKIIVTQEQIDDIKNFRQLDISDTELEFVQNEIRYERLNFILEEELEDKSKINYNDRQTC